MGLEKIEQLIEQRKFDAVRDKISEKLYLVARFLGRPIVSQSFNDEWWEDVRDMNGWEYSYADKIRLYEMGEEDSSIARGFYFDGLRHGRNFCIKASVYDDKLAELEATFNGYRVYLEEEGNVKCYVPDDTWKNFLDKVCVFAEAKQKESNEEIKKVARQDDEKKYFKFLKELKDLWGIG